MKVSKILEDVQNFKKKFLKTLLNNSFKVFKRMYRENRYTATQLFTMVILENTNQRWFLNLKINYRRSN